MICLHHPVFAEKCCKKTELKLVKFAQQAYLMELKLLDYGVEVVNFDLGRDDLYQFAVFTLSQVSVDVGDFLKDQLNLMIQKSDLDLFDAAYSFKCSRCKNLHIACYIKPLSESNPFKSGELDQHFYMCNINTSFFIN